MIFTVKLDKKNNYFLDKETGEKLDRYDSTNSNLQLHLKLKDCDLNVDTSLIVQEYGGQIAFQHDGNKYIIDDGFQDTLVKCGYIVYKNFDNERVNDNSEGILIRDSLVNKIRRAVASLNYDKEIETLANETLMTIKTESYSFKFRFDTVGNIVTKNYRRKDNSLTYYPFDKSMDKYGTIYVSIFAEKLKCGCTDNDKFNVPSEIIKDLVKELGLEYHYVSLPIKGRVLYWQGL